MGSRLVLMAYVMPDTFCVALYTTLKLPWPSTMGAAVYSVLHTTQHAGTHACMRAAPCRAVPYYAGRQACA